MKIKCIITDDEPIARKGLRGYIEKVDFLTLTGECEDAVQLNTILKTQEIDLLFLDIEMPEMTGIELLSNLTNPPKVIIVSAYEQYALKGYEFNVVDYLLKPVSFDRFIKSVNKIYDLLQTEQKEKNDYIFVKSNKLLNLKSATKLFSVLLASKRPLITELADKLRLKYPLLPTISPCPTMRLEAIRSIIPISCRRYPKSV